ncbi:MAG: TIR domain-containing protein [Chloroflexota bacterium]
MTDTPNVFISYARADGSDYSERLRDTLRADGITCWRDDRIDPTIDFTGEIETALDEATHVAVIVTADLKRADSFVRLEIGYALTHKKPIIPLVFEGGHRPITIINHTYISFVDWDTGYEMLLTRLKDFGTGEIDPATLQERELAYIQAVGRAYDHWRDLYTDLSAVARIEERKVKPKSAAARYLQMRHKIHQKRDYSPDAEKGKVVTTESFDELREGIRKYGRVALIGDPGAGKTTTLERLAYEYAASAVDDKGERIAGTPLPLFVRLGAYDGTDFTQFLASFFGNLPLENYLPDGVLLLLDGLNEMPAEHMGTVEAWLREHENVKVIVSCRKLEYVERKLPLQRIDVAPLDLERIRLFLTNYLEDEDRDRLFWGLAGYEARKAWAWYQGKVDEATYRSFFTATDKIGDEWEPERKSLDRIRQALREDAQLPDMLGVVTNPFLLFGVIEIFIIEGTVPRNKGELFGHFVDSLLAERGQVAEREDRPWIVENKQKQALATLAYQMQAEKRGTSVALDFVMQCFHDAVPEEDPDTLLYFAISASILEQSDTVRFSHQLLQEYFAAYEMGEDMRRGVPASKYFPSDAWWEPTGWEETAVLLAGMEGNASTVVKWLTPIQPDLAYKVATESGAVCSGDAMQGLYRPAEGARRSPYALAEWGRKIADDDSRPGVGLRADGLPDIVWGEPVVAGTYKIGGDEKARKSLPEQDVTFDYSYRLAIYPITVKQFEIFLKVQDGIALDRWWSSLSFGWGDKQVGEQTEKSANHPRTDVNWYQAVAFCRWLTVQYRDANLLDADSEIRLPTGQEWEVVAQPTR